MDDQMIFAIFIKLASGVMLMSDIPTFKTKAECETRLAEMNVRDTYCLPLTASEKE
jgi:hypothetical protein